MRNVIVLSAILLGFGGQAFADDLDFQSGDAPPIRLHYTHKQTIVRQGIKPIAVLDGLTPLDKGLHPVTCSSAAGCFVTAKVWVAFEQGQEVQASVSAYVDGVAMNPAASVIQLELIDAQQSGFVSQGAHTLQSQVSQSFQSSHVTGWNAEYTIYELK